MTPGDIDHLNTLIDQLYREITLYADLDIQDSMQFRLDEVRDLLPFKKLNSYTLAELNHAVAGGEGLNGLEVLNENNMSFYITNRDPEYRFLVVNPKTGASFLSRGEDLRVTGNRYKFVLEDEF